MRKLRKPLLVAIATLVALGALEIGLRVIGVSVGTVHISRMTIEADDNPNLLYRLKPGGVAQAEVEYRINPQGMRSPPVSLAKPPGTRRVAVMGDSLAFGYWVPADHTMPAHLAEMLNRFGDDRTRYQVLNFGVPGYNLSQEIELLRTSALRFDPDAVVFAFCLNDLESRFSYDYGLVQKRSEERESAGILGSLWNFGLDHSRLCAWIEYRRAEFAARRRFAGRGPRESGDEVQDGDREAAREELGALYGQAAEILRERDIPGFVVIYPTIECTGDPYQHAWVHEEAAAAASASGFQVIDLLSAYEGRPGGDLFVDPFHPSPLGHRLAAHLVFEGLSASPELGWDNLDPAGPGAPEDYRAEDFPKPRGF